MAGLLARLRLAWRDLWAQGRRSVFFALLVAAGVASLVGVQGMARSLEDSMHATARRMMQADVVINKSRGLTPDQTEALHALEHEGAHVTETLLSSAHVKNDQGHAMIEVKVVDPAVWPFYGGLRTSPAGIRPRTGEALVAPELLTKLGLDVGDSIDLGKTTVTVAGTLLEEPRPLGEMPVGPRVLISPETWNSASPGSKAQVLVKLPETMTAADARTRLLSAFDPDEVATSDDAWKSMASLMEQVFTFLAMVALISLLVGGLGVAMGMRTFISQKLEHIAVLKALGASSGTVMSVFLAEAAILGIGGSLAGAGLGLGVQILLPKLFEGLYPVGSVALDWGSAMGGLSAGAAIAVLSALVPIRAIRGIKPVTLFRGETGGSRTGWKARAESAFVGLITLAGVAWMAMTYAKSARIGLGFLAGLLAAALLLLLTAWTLLRLLRLLPQSGRPATRHAVRSLNAPGNQSASVVVAMGLGIMLMTTVYLVQASLLQQLKTVGAGPDVPNLFIMSQDVGRRGELVEFLENHQHVWKVMDSVLAVNAELAAVDGQTPPSQEGAGGGTIMVTDSPKALPKGVVLMGGEWFTAADTGKPKVTVAAQLAKAYGLNAGSTLTLRIKGEPLTVTVASIYTTTGDASMTMSLGMIAAAPGFIDTYSDNYMVTAAAKPNREEQVMLDLVEAHPESMPISLRGYLDLVESVIARVANILRFLTAFAVAAAGVILSGSLSATRFRRRKEGALLKSLGATRLTVAMASALENGLLGIVAGVAGGGLAYALIQLAGMALNMILTTSLMPLAAASAAGGLLAVAVGLGTTLDVLQVKPLSVLRSE